MVNLPIWVVGSVTLGAPQANSPLGIAAPTNNGKTCFSNIRRDRFLVIPVQLIRIDFLPRLIKLLVLSGKSVLNRMPSTHDSLLMTAIFSNASLRKKFNLLLIAVFLGAVLLSGLAFSAILNHNAEREVTVKATSLLKTMLAVRDYTSTQVNPQLAARLETEAEFLPQTVPGYSAREVFENLRKNPDYGDYFYKEATLNPTNLRDKADRFESELVERFRNNASLKEVSGYRSSPAGNLFYIARPIVIAKESCLRCHSTPEAAPKSQLATYGSANGFGWKLNEIVGAQVLSVPASGVIGSAHRSFLVLMSIVVITFILMLLVLNLLLKRAVILPLNQIATVANEVSMGNLEAEFDQPSKDEIGKLSTAFNRMKTSLVMAMNMLETPKR
jgi:HAMP domain-containing protein